MFTKQYYRNLINSNSSSLNPIDELVKSVFLNRKPKKDFIINTSNSILSKTLYGYEYKTIAVGLDQEEIEVYIQDSHLFIHTKELTREDNIADPFKVIINHKIKLKDKVDEDNIISQLSNGVLKVIVPFKTF